MSSEAASTVELIFDALSDDDDASSDTSSVTPPVANASPVPKRNHSTLNEKMRLCIATERKVYTEKSISLKSLCRSHSIQPSQLRRWRKNLANIRRKLENKILEWNGILSLVVVLVGRILNPVIYTRD